MVLTMNNYYLIGMFRLLTAVIVQMLQILTINAHKLVSKRRQREQSITTLLVMEKRLLLLLLMGEEAAP
jgi:hypothetical protein